MDRRAFLKRLGVGGAGAVAVGAPAGTYLAGDHRGDSATVNGHVTGALMRTAADLGHDVAVWTYGRGPAAGQPDQVADSDVAGIERYMIDQIDEGPIVILHDGIGRSAFEWTGPDDQLVRQREAEVQALPAVLERYLADGYRFLTISELIDGYGRSDGALTA